MGCLTALRKAWDAGLTVDLADGNLRVTGPKAAADCIPLLAEHKAGIINLLSQRCDPWATLRPGERITLDLFTGRITSEITTEAAAGGIQA